MDRWLVERLVAAATGEGIREIRRRGFQHANPIDVTHDPEPSLQHYRVRKPRPLRREAPARIGPVEK